MNTWRSWFVLWVLLLFVLGLVAPRAGAAPSVAEIEHQIQQIEQEIGLAPELKAKLLEAYTQAKAFQNQAEQAREKAEEFTRLEKTANDQLEQLRDQLAALQGGVVIQKLEDAPLPQIEQALREAQATLQAARDQATTLEQEATTAIERQREIPKQIAEARQRLQAIEAQLGLLPSAVGDERLAKALRVQLKAEREALTAQIKAYEQELRSYATRRRTLASRRDLAAQRVQRAEERITALKQLLTTRREQELGVQRAQIKTQLRETAKIHSYLVQLVQTNDELLTRREQLTTKLEQAERQETEIETELKALSERFNQVKERVNAVGLTGAVGQLLRKQSEKLPNLFKLRGRRDALQEEIGQTRIELMELDEQRTQLRDLDPLVEERLAELEPPTESEAKRAELKPAIRELLETRRRYVQALNTDLNRYFNQLIRLDARLQSLIKEAQAFKDYISVNVLWIPSGSFLGIEELRSLDEAVQWLVAWQNWSEFIASTWGKPQSRPAIIVLFVIGLASLFYLQWHCRRQLRLYTGQIRQVPKGSFRFSLYALFMTVGLALPGGILLWVGGWWLTESAEGAQFGTALGAGLKRTAFIWFILRFLAQLVQEGGLAGVHFRWRPETLSLLRYHTAWMQLVLPPLVFLSSVLTAQSNEVWRESLGRLVFIVTMVVLAFAGQRLIASKRHLFRGVIRRQPHGWLARLYWLWISLAIGIPVTLAIAAAVGYFFTAAHLQDRFFFSVCLVVGLTLVNEVIRRWLIEEQKGLARKQVRGHRGDEGETEEEGVSPAAEIDEGYDLSVINTQTRKLLHTAIGLGLFLGLWIIWATVLPALNRLEQIPLWTDPSYESPVTLASLGLTGVIVVLTVVATRNIPGVLEIVALKRLPLAASTRYAITTVSRYLITTVGVVVAFGMLGVGWSKVQWLVAAISVGLGFGLQEIFANFVSGLILLFEQPIRVGDTVTVNGVSGTVSRIRIRATTILDWDYKELVIPNKSFVTGDVINWTLSDTILRVTIPVGIAYGSDTAQAERILYQIAQEQEYVLDDPAPQVFFLSFGEHSLEFELRVYIPAIEHLLGVKHALCFNIDQAFRKAGIEIALPQRDLHIRSIDQALPIGQAFPEGRKALGA